MNNMSKFSDNSLIILKDSLWLERQKVAGKAVAECLKTFYNLNKINISLKEINEICFEILNKHKCTPTFYNYKGFPGYVCLSVNEHLVHGIPSDYVIQAGDVVSLDLGATFEGAIADAAITRIFGEPKSQRHQDLVSTCFKSLNNAISTIKVEKNLGCIGEAIWNTVKQSGFSLITDYGGHGINYNTPHAKPFVASKANGYDGVRIQPGLSIAIEPILVDSDSDKSFVTDDGWTVQGYGIGAHFEHSVTIDCDGNVHVITDHGVVI